MINSFSVHRFLLLLAFFAVNVAAEDQYEKTLQDPWEPMNRSVHTFNLKVDQYVLLPVAKAYQAVMPQALDKGVTNIFDNIRVIGTFINDLLQLELVDAGKDILRFSANSTFGILGFVDVATKMGISYEREDFGLTFAKWGVPAGPYLNLPLWGPSTVRDAFGLIPEQYFSPTLHIDHVPTRNTVTATYYVDSRADVIQLSDLVTGDSYNFLRDAYLQNRRTIINGGFLEDDFGEENFEEDEFEEF